MVVAPKSNGKVRVCLGLSKLNEYVKRENDPLPAVDTTLGRLAGCKVFSKLDANPEFWQIKLAWESRQPTTFITHGADSPSMFYPLVSTLVLKNSRRT